MPLRVSFDNALEHTASVKGKIKIPNKQHCTPKETFAHHKKHWQPHHAWLCCHGVLQSLAYVTQPLRSLNNGAALR